jgi:tol-pal system protein YbgF
MFRPAHPLRAIALISLAFTLVTPAWAFFGDDEARKAILELRQTFEEQRRVNAEGAAVMRRSILDVSTQAEQWRQELGALRGEQERLQQENLRLQQALATLEARLKTFEPVSIEQDGVTLLVSPTEKAAFDRAMVLLLASDFTKASAAYVQLLNQDPHSAYTASVLYWLGNAQYAVKDYKESMANFQQMLKSAPTHPRAPEAMLAISNVQIELKDLRGARKTMDELIKAYPASETAATARERLARLR